MPNGNGAAEAENFAVGRCLPVAMHSGRRPRLARTSSAALRMHMAPGTRRRHFRKPSTTTLVPTGPKLTSGSMRLVPYPSDLAARVRVRGLSTLDRDVLAERRRRRRECVTPSRSVTCQPPPRRAATSKYCLLVSILRAPQCVTVTWAGRHALIRYDTGVPCQPLLGGSVHQAGGRDHLEAGGDGYMDGWIAGSLFTE